MKRRLGSTGVYNKKGWCEQQSNNSFSIPFSFSFFLFFSFLAPSFLFFDSVSDVIAMQIPLT
ncbi:uncharacterized protein BO96DRAFT_189825 [Aspergillus niger CBS 101883]|uniref:uncharacterized protein n=1 Tax=Aspergillus lacticoffeatus (strain CBS 101883) TaxID=1450533 RepID=UPI000D7F6A2F|nr:uncharacterized protein BO96DRAFT_189825 [Aspergillus niger CBS 101883]PYH51586.1 hypothetical protein BO96DRAFT_189825 [Aspergillus niger CBS 101883]